MITLNLILVSKLFSKRLQVSEYVFLKFADNIIMLCQVLISISKTEEEKNVTQATSTSTWFGSVLIFKCFDWKTQNLKLMKLLYFWLKGTKSKVNETYILALFTILESSSEVFSHEFVRNWNRLHLNWKKIEIVLKLGRGTQPINNVPTCLIFKKTSIIRIVK